MNTLNNLLDKALKTCGLPSDAQLAAKMGVSRSAVSLWRQGAAIKEAHLAELVKLAKGSVLDAVQVMEEQATTKASKDLWSKALLKLAAVAITLAPMLSIAGENPSESKGCSDYQRPVIVIAIKNVRQWVMAALRRMFAGNPNTTGHQCYVRG